MEENKIAPESTNMSAPSTDSVMAEQGQSVPPTIKLINDGDVSKSNVELVKAISDILSSGNRTAPNITINNINGNCYNDSASDNSLGHGNTFAASVSISHGSVKTPDVTNNNVSIIDLSNYSAVYKYLKEEQQDPYCSLIIALSIFENSQFDLVSDEAKILYSILSEEQRTTTNQKGDTIIVKREPFEVSRQESTAIFSIQFYLDTLITQGGRIETTFISFSSEEHALNILRCIFSEFVALKDKITAFLTKLICSEKVTLYAAAINTLKKLCDINPEYFISRIVVRLLQEKTIPSDIAVAQVLCSIAEHSKNIYSADKYLGVISNIDKDIHYYIITLMMCRTLSFNQDKIGKLIRPILWELITQPGLQFMLNSLKIDLPEDEDFINNVDLFFNIGNRYPEYYIALVSELHKILENMKRNDSRRDFVHFITLLFIKEDYAESCLNTANPNKFKDMIFIRLGLRGKDVSEKLVYLWAEILRNRKFKHAAEGFLEKYLVFRDGFVSENDEYLKLESFFIKLMNDRKIHNNILFFIKNISTRPRNPIPLANKIYENIGGNYNG